MTSTNHNKTIQSKMAKLDHFRECGAMSEEFNVVIENPITAKEAVKITGYSLRQINRFCVEYQESQGERGLKSVKLGSAKTLPWLIEKSAAEEFKKKNVNKTKT